MVTNKFNHVKPSDDCPRCTCIREYNNILGHRNKMEYYNKTLDNSDVSYDHKAYVESNNKFNEYRYKLHRGEKYNCICKSEIYLGNWNSHVITNQHKNYMERLNQLIKGERGDKYKEELDKFYKDLDEKKIALAIHIKANKKSRSDFLEPKLESFNS